MIFLLAAEDRGLLHLPDATAATRSLYAAGYSLSRLRDSAVRPAAWDAHDDLWDGICILFAALARGEPRLALPALDGLFALGATPDLDNAALSNSALLRAVRGLAWLDSDGAPVPVNWRDMETEELGSVYEIVAGTDAGDQRMTAMASILPEVRRSGATSASRPAAITLRTIWYSCCSPRHWIQYWTGYAPRQKIPPKHCLA